MTVTRYIEADLLTVPDAVVGARTVVAIPPSAADAAAGLIRVEVSGVEITRAYDPVLEQP